MSSFLQIKKRLSSLALVLKGGGDAFKKERLVSPPPPLKERFIIKKGGKRLINQNLWAFHTPPGFKGKIVKKRGEGKLYIKI